MPFCVPLKLSLILLYDAVRWTYKQWRAQVAQWVRKLDYLTTQTSLSPIRRGFAPGFVNYKNGCTRLAATSDKGFQLFAHGRWFSPGTPASSTTKHNILSTLDLHWLDLILSQQNTFIILIFSDALISTSIWFSLLVFSFSLFWYIFTFHINIFTLYFLIIHFSPNIYIWFEFTYDWISDSTSNKHF